MAYRLYSNKDLMTIIKAVDPNHRDFTVVIMLKHESSYFFNVIRF